MDHRALVWGAERGRNLRLQAPIANARCARVIVNDPAHGIATEQNAVGPQEHICAIQDVGIDGDGILQMTAPVNGVVHANAVDNKQYPVGLKPPQNRRTTTLLALLDQDGACGPQQFRRSLGYFQLNDRFWPLF